MRYVPHCAFDAIETPVPAKCEVLYHGSLATREQPSRQALWQLRSNSPKLIFFDVNLRHPWWRHDEIEELLAGTHWVKLNQEELSLLQPGGSKSREAMESFLEQHRLEGLILTRGADGAELLTRAGDYCTVAPEQATRLVDTVGAGDAFTAVAILGLLREMAATATAGTGAAVRRPGGRPAGRYHRRSAILCAAAPAVAGQPLNLGIPCTNNSLIHC